MTTSVNGTPIAIYGLSNSNLISKKQIPTVSTRQIKNLQKLSHCDTHNSNTGGGTSAVDDPAGAAAWRVCPAAPPLNTSAGARSRNSPQCLHFFAIARITSPQNGHRFVASSDVVTAPSIFFGL